MMSMAGSALSRLCITITGTPRAAITPAIAGSRCRPQTSLAIAAPASSAQATTSAFMLSIETGVPSATTSASTGCSRCHFLGRGDRLRAIGPGGFRADVDDVGALGDHPAGLRAGAVRRQELSAVGKRVRGDVEHAHHGRNGRASNARSSE